MTLADVSAVVVAWNAGLSLAVCVDSLRSSAQQGGLGLQIVVVDNASTDGSPEDLSLCDGDIRIRNEVNAGYAVAVSQGMARAVAPWILLVNPDLTVAPEFFTELADAAGHAPSAVATLVAEMRFSSQPNVVNCRGLTIDEIGVPAEVDAGAYGSSEPSLDLILGGSSGCCLLRASAVRELGGPEPAFFAYLEDVDLALRLQRAGYRTVYVPGAVAWHEGSASTGSESRLKVFLVARNRRLLFRFHGPYSLRARLLRLAVEAGHGLVSSLHGTGLAPWIGRADSLRLRPYVRFVRHSRGEHDPHRAEPLLAPRVTLIATLRRKRSITRSKRTR